MDVLIIGIRGSLTGEKNSDSFLLFYVIYFNYTSFHALCCLTLKKLNSEEMICGHSSFHNTNKCPDLID